MDVLCVVAFNVLSGAAAFRLTRWGTRMNLDTTCPGTQSTVRGQVPKKRHDAFQQVRRCVNCRETNRSGRANT